MSYDVEQNTIIWDLFSGAEIARFTSFDQLCVAAWMRNGNLAFGNIKGEVILFEPSTSDHISICTINDSITALAPSADCQTYAIGYRNGSILMATLLPTFTIIHTLTVSQEPSLIAGLAWHASSPKQKSDMLAVQSANGELKVLSVAKPPIKELPRTIRLLKRPYPVDSSAEKWISWSRNGKVVQYLDGKTWAWDVKTKNATYEIIPTVDNVCGIANYGPTSTLFTLGPENTVQQYDVENPALVANVLYSPAESLSRSSSASRARDAMQPNLQPEIEEAGQASATGRTPSQVNGIEGQSSRNSSRSRTTSVSSKESPDRHRMTPLSPPSKSIKSGTSFSFTSISRGEPPLHTGSPVDYASSFSLHSMRSPPVGVQPRDDIHTRHYDNSPIDLFPFTRARLSSVPYRQHGRLDETSPDNWRREMLSVVFGWDYDIRALIKDEQTRHPVGSQAYILLAQWLGETSTDQMVSLIGSGPVWVSDWMLLAFSQMSGHQGQRNGIGEAFVQKLLGMGDVHAAAAILLGLEDLNDAIEVYVSRGHFMEAILLTCLLMPSDLQRQQYLVRRWGEDVVFNSQQQLAMRCFICADVDPWASPNPHQTSFSQFSRTALPSPGLLFSNTLSSLPPDSVGNRLPPKTPSLRLVTSFDMEKDKRMLNVPDLTADDKTPIAPRIRPIVESAVGESAFSPGLQSTFKGPNMQSLNCLMPARSKTPGYARNRLSAIGETPVDVHPPAFPTTSPPQKKTTAADEQMQDNGPRQGDELLLPSVRYDPRKEATGHRSPQTAIQANLDEISSLKGPPPPRDGVFDELRERPASQNNRRNRNRKPDRLQIQLPSSASTTFAQDESDFSSKPMDSAASCSSFQSTATASTAGRSLDQYISSLEEANYHVKRQQERRERQNKADSSGQDLRRIRSRDVSQERRGRTATKSLLPPVSMSSEAVAQCRAVGENQNHDSTTQTEVQYSKLGSESKARKAVSRPRTPSRRRQARSSSRNPAGGGRSRTGWSSRMDDSAVMSSSSSPPTSPQTLYSPNRVNGLDSALQLVVGDRERLRTERNRSRLRSERGISSRRRRSSSAARRARPHSNSRRKQEPDISTPQKTSNSAANVKVGETCLNQRRPSEEPRKDPAEEELRKRKELAAAELEARRLSLARNPSAPNIPFPGQPLPVKSAVDQPSPFALNSRTYTPKDTVPPNKPARDYSSSPDSGSSRSGVSLAFRSTAQAPQGLTHSNDCGEGYIVEVHNNVSDEAMFLTDARYSNKPEDTPRSMSVPIPELQGRSTTLSTDIPVHPRFIASLPQSRSAAARTQNTEQNKDNTSHDNSSPVMISIEETPEYDSIDLAITSAPISSTAKNFTPPPPPLPPILPELQHLYNDTSPLQHPPAGLKRNSSPSPRISDSSGMIEIAIDDSTEKIGNMLPRAMTVAPVGTTTMVSPVEGGSFYNMARRRSLDSRRSRSIINEAFSSKIRSFTGRRTQNSGRGVLQSPASDSQVSPFR